MFASFTRNTMVMGGISRFLSSPWRKVTLRVRGAQRVISPSLRSLWSDGAALAAAAAWWLSWLPPVAGGQRQGRAQRAGQQQGRHKVVQWLHVDAFGL